MIESISKETIYKAKEIYECLEDEESKRIFLDKLLFSITGNDKFWHDIVKLRNPNIFQRLHELSIAQKEIIIYGAGYYCARVLELCKRMTCNVSCLCDKDIEKQKKGYGDFSVISPEELVKKHKSAYVIISTLRFRNEVKEQLLENFSEEQVILFVEDSMAEHLANEYFAPDIIKFEEAGEVFVDGGSYDFETSQFLLQRCNVKKIFAFEPDKYNIPKVQRGIEESGCKNVVLYEKGLWNKTDTLCFSANGDMCSRVANGGSEDNKIEVVALDDVIDEKVTFIKMDIEGSELNALEGAKKIICKYRPKLAICIYHKHEDIIDIPAYIKSLVPEYKLYIRHYNTTQWDTILYATL